MVRADELRQYLSQSVPRRALTLAKVRQDPSVSPVFFDDFRLAEFRPGASAAAERVSDARDRGLTRPRGPHPWTTRLSRCGATLAVAVVRLAGQLPEARGQAILGVHGAYVPPNGSVWRSRAEYLNRLKRWVRSRSCDYDHPPAPLFRYSQGAGMHEESRFTQRYVGRAGSGGACSRGSERHAFPGSDVEGMHLQRPRHQATVRREKALRALVQGLAQDLGELTCAPVLAAVAAAGVERVPGGQQGPLRGIQRLYLAVEPSLHVGAQDGSSLLREGFDERRHEPPAKEEREGEARAFPACGAGPPVPEAPEHGFQDVQGEIVRACPAVPPVEAAGREVHDVVRHVGIRDTARERSVSTGLPAPLHYEVPARILSGERAIVEQRHLVSLSVHTPPRRRASAPTRGKARCGAEGAPR